MNAHDPAKRPGAHIVAEEFGIDDPWDLTDNRPLHTPHDVVGRLVAGAAREVDRLHGELTRAARSALQALEPIAKGDHTNLSNRDYVLGPSANEMQLLLERRTTAYEELNRTIASYRRLPAAEPTEHTGAPDVRLGLGARERPNDGWAIGDGRRLAALEAVEAGGLRYRQSAVYGFPYLSDGTGRRPDPWPETISRLLADGLLHQDTSAGLYEPGQLLSLTPDGDAALQEDRTATSRVAAALHRSQAVPLPGFADAETSPTPASRTSAQPSHTR